MITIDKLDVSPDMIGECPLWDGLNGRLYWIDGLEGRVRALELSSGREHLWPAPDRVGSIGLAADGLLVALQHTLCRLDLASGRMSILAEISEDPNTPLNDGKINRQGRFVCGQMSLDGAPIGVLYRFTVSGKVEALADGVRLANGVCFSPAGDRMYFADSLRRKIQVFPYDPSGDYVGAPSLLWDAAADGTMPDGATVDAEGCLWVALPPTGDIAQIGPQGVLQRIALPVDFPSCPAFGGEDLDVLYVTTIKDSGTGRVVSTHPDGGSIFAIRGLGVHGVAEGRFGSSSGS